MRQVGVLDAGALMSSDIGPEEFEALTKAVGTRLAELTGMPVEEAESLAVSVACCRTVDDDGNLVFRDADEREVVRLAYAAFAEILDDDEEQASGHPDSEEA